MCEARRRRRVPDRSFDEVRTEVIACATPEPRGPVAPPPPPEKQTKGTRAARKLHYDPCAARAPANPRAREPVVKEFFAGTKRLSTELKTTYGCACETIDDGSWPGAARPSRRCCVLDYSIEDVGWVDGAHFAFPCRTFSALAIEHHRPLVVRGRRVLEGSSISPEAQKANAVVRHCIELMREARRVNPECVLMAENPATGYLQHFQPWRTRSASSGSCAAHHLLHVRRADPEADVVLERHPGAPPGSG